MNCLSCPSSASPAGWAQEAAWRRRRWRQAVARCGNSTVRDGARSWGCSTFADKDADVSRLAHSSACATLERSSSPRCFGRSAQYQGRIAEVWKAMNARRVCGAWHSRHRRRRQQGGRRRQLPHPIRIPFVFTFVQFVQFMATRRSGHVFVHVEYACTRAAVGALRGAKPHQAGARAAAVEDEAWQRVGRGWRDRNNDWHLAAAVHQRGTAAAPSASTQIPLRLPDLHAAAHNLLGCALCTPIPCSPGTSLMMTPNILTLCSPDCVSSVTVMRTWHASVQRWQWGGGGRDQR